jgi:hypothetical protein
MASLAETYNKRYLWKEVEDLEMQYMEVAERSFSYGYTHALYSMDVIARVFSDRGQWNEAKELISVPKRPGQAGFA